MPIPYKGTTIEAGFRGDIVVDRTLIVEIKGVDTLGCEPKLCDQAAALGDSFGWLRLAGACVLAAIPVQ